MEYEKVLILAVDGLEYNLVVNLRLRSLLQKTYGSIKIDKGYYSHNAPYTPRIWMSFITGIRPEQHNINEWIFYDNSFIEWIRKKPPFKWIKRKKRPLRRLIRPKVMNKKYWDKDYKTIFDIAKPSIPLYIPAYNIPYEYHEKLENAFYKGLNEYIKTIWELHRLKVRELYRNLDKEYRLLMIWFDLVDLLGHVCFIKNRNQLIRGYKELNKLVYGVSRKLDDVVILIISDHGMRLGDDGVSGEHSKHNFWSLNINTAWRPRDIIDFYPIIEKLILEP